MNVFSKIGFSTLLVFALFAFPASAWSQTWELHPQDIDESDFREKWSGEGDQYYHAVTKGLYLNGSSMYVSGSERVITINETYNGYLGYTASKKSGSGWFKVGLVLTDINGTTVFTDTEMYASNDITGFKRVEFIETTTGTGIECYVDGVKGDSTAYSTTGTPVTISLRITYENSAAWIDDISSVRGVIDTDDTCTYSETGQYVKFGVSNMTSSYWFTRIYDPAGELINQFNITTGTEYLLPIDELLQDGQYEIAVYRHYNVTNQNIYYINKLFTNTLPSSASMDFIDQVYAPGETVRITGHMSPFYPGYSIAVRGQYPRDTAYYTLTQEDQTFLYVVPDNATDGSRSVTLRNPSNTTIAYGFFDVAGGTSGSTIRFDKAVYTNTNEISLRYTDIPTGATITVEGTLQGAEVFSTVYTKTGSGIFVHQLAGDDVNKVTVILLKDGVVIDSDYAEVANGEYRVSGVVYDTEDRTTISGAAISCAGRQATSGTFGVFSIIVPAGTQTFQIAATGYTTQTITIDVISISQTNDFYLVAVPVAGENANMLYGLVTDSANGEPLQSTYIQLNNKTTGVSYSTLSWTDTGHYSFDYAGLVGSWEVVAQKTGYVNYKSTITITGQTYLNIQMRDADEAASIPDWNNEDDDDEDDDGIPDDVDTEDNSAGATDTDTDAERPGRQAAKDSMEMFEGIIPGLIGIALLRVLMELLT